MGNPFSRQLSCLAINEDQYAAVLIYSKVPCFYREFPPNVIYFFPQKVNSDSRRKQNKSILEEMNFSFNPLHLTSSWGEVIFFYIYALFCFLQLLIIFFISRQLAIGLLNQNKRFCLHARVVPSVLPNRHLPSLFSLQKCWFLLTVNQDS